LKKMKEIFFQVVSLERRFIDEKTTHID